MLWRISNETGMEVVILRPPLVYGPGVRGNFLRLLQLVASGFPLPFANVGNRRDLIYVGNLVDAIVTCIGHPQAAGQTFLVCDDEPLSTPDLITRLAQVMGKTPRLFSVPSFFFRALGYVGGKATLQRLTGSLQIDSSHIQHTLNWYPPFPVHEGLQATVQWYLTEHG
jgi:nucleoside-diphosphate-sugar epimerase